VQQPVLVLAAAHGDAELVEHDNLQAVLLETAVYTHGI